MYNCVVWLDQENAKIFELNPKAVVEEELAKREIRHHNGSDKQQNNHKNSEKFFCEVAKHLLRANEILLIGPGVAKEHFKDHVTEHHHNEIAKKIVATQTVDHPSDGQIVALAKQYFKAHLAFE